MWQTKFERYRDMGFTVVGIALDAEGIEPARRYYEKHRVTFPALVDPNYATGFGAVPKTFFVNEHGVVQPLEGWEKSLKPKDSLRPVTDRIRAQWTEPGERLAPSEIARLVRRHEAVPSELPTAVELASRYLDLGLNDEASRVLQAAVGHYRPRRVSAAGSERQARLLGQAYFQLSRASAGQRERQVRYATLSFYLSPSVGYGKQIARIIAPEKFDRPDGTFDNDFREGTLRRLRRERRRWLQNDGKQE